mgnify:CR=1 FL=1
MMFNDVNYFFLLSDTKLEMFFIPCNQLIEVSSFPRQNGDVNLENVTHEDAVACLKSTLDTVVLVLGKVTPSTTNASVIPPTNDVQGN